jgi:hypothetical protein
LRVRRASDSALAVANHFQGHPTLQAVLYPGLPSHPGHQVAARQMREGFGGVLSIRLVGGAEQAMAVLPVVRVFKLSDGELTVTAVFDKPDTPQGPTFEETVLVTPSRLPQPILSEALGTAARAAAALRLRHGPIHAELRLDARDSGRRPTMLELAARSIGGLCSRALRFWTG